MRSSPSDSTSPRSRSASPSAPNAPSTTPAVPELSAAATTVARRPPGGEGREPRSEGALEAVRGRDRVGERLGARKLAGRQQVGQLDERERVPVSGIENPRQHLRRNPSFVLGQHAGRVFAVERADRYDPADRAQAERRPAERQRRARGYRRVAVLRTRARRGTPNRPTAGRRRRSAPARPRLLRRGARASPPRRRNDRRPRADRARARSTARPPGPPGAHRGDAAPASATSISAAYGRSASDSTPAVSRTVIVPACSTRPRSSVVLPMPGSPTSTSALPRPSRADASAAASAADSTWRPISIFVSLGLSPVRAPHGASKVVDACPRGWYRRPGTACENTRPEHVGRALTAVGART